MRSLFLMFRNLRNKTKKALTKVGALLTTLVETIGDLDDLDFD